MRPGVSLAAHYMRSDPNRGGKAIIMGCSMSSFFGSQSCFVKKLLCLSLLTGLFDCVQCPESVPPKEVLLLSSGVVSNAFRGRRKAFSTLPRSMPCSGLLDLCTWS